MCLPYYKIPTLFFNKKTFMVNFKMHQFWRMMMRKLAFRTSILKPSIFCGFFLFGLLSIMPIHPAFADIPTDICDTSNGCHTDNCRTCCKETYHYDSGFCDGDTANTTTCICTVPLSSANINQCTNTCTGPAE